MLTHNDRWTFYAIGIGGDPGRVARRQWQSAGVLTGGGLFFWYGRGVELSAAGL